MAIDNVTQQAVSLTDAEKALYREQLSKKPLMAQHSVSYVSDALAGVFDTILTLGQETTYRINNGAKLSLMSQGRDIAPTKLFGLERTGRVKAIFDALMQEQRIKTRNSVQSNIELKQSVWDKKKQLIEQLESNTITSSWSRPTVFGILEDGHKKYPKLSQRNIDDSFMQEAFGAFVNDHSIALNRSINGTKSDLDAARNKLTEVRKKLLHENNKKTVLQPIIRDGEIVKTKLAPFVGEAKPLETYFLKVDETSIVDGKAVKTKYREFDQAELESVLEKGRFALDNPDKYKAQGKNKYAEIYLGLTSDERADVEEVININRESIAYNKSISEKTAAINNHNKWIDLSREENELVTKVHQLSTSLQSQKEELVGFEEPLKKGIITEETSALFREHIKAPYALDKVGERPTMPENVDDLIDTDDIDKFMQTAYDEASKDGAFEFQPLKPSELTQELENIDNPTLRALVDAQYQEVVDKNGNKMMQPTPFMGLYDIDVTTDDYSFKVNGVADIQAPGYDPRNAQSYLETYDGYAHVSKEFKDESRLGDGTHVSEVGRRISEYQELQKDMSLEAKKASYLKLANNELEPIVNPAETRVHQKEVIPYRIANMMGDTSLIEGSPITSAKERTVAKEVQAPTATRSPMNIVLDELSSQDTMPELKYSAQGFKTKLDIFKRFSNSIANGDYDKLASAIRTSDGADPITGMLATSYKKALEEANIDTTVEFGSLTQADQKSIAQRMSNIMTGDLEGSLIGLQGKVREAGKNTVASTVYDALSSHNETANSDRILAINELRRGTLVTNDTTLLERLNGGLDMEQVSNIDKMYDSLYSSLDAQDDILLKNVGNAMSVKNKRENEAYIASIKNNYERLRPLELGSVEGRVGFSFTPEELSTGVVMSNGNATPIEHYKQYYTMNSMKQIMGDDWSHFTPEQWATGQVTFGKTTMPITQFAEYYTKAERGYQFINHKGGKAHEAYARSLSYEDFWAEMMMAREDEATTYKFGLSDSDRAAWKTYMSREESFASDKGEILVKKQNDAELVRKLNNAKDSGSMINVHGDVVPYTVSEVTDNVAVLKQNAININEATVSLSWDGDGDLLTALEETETLMRSVTKDKYTYDLDSDGKEYLARNYKENLDKVLPGSENTTRKMLLDSLEYKDGMPKVFTDTVASSFTWMMTPDNIEELPGLSYLATSRAFADLNDLEIQTVLTKHGLDPNNIADWDRGLKEAAINDLVSHKIETNVLLGFMSEQSGGDRIDTMIRVAKNVATQQGINPSIDDVKAGLLQIKKGTQKLKSEDSKAYFSAVDELLGDDTLLRERMLGAYDSGPISLERIGELMNEELDKLDAYDSIDALDESLGPLGKRNNLEYQSSFGIIKNGEESIDELQEIYKRSKKNMLDEYFGDPSNIGIKTSDIVDEYNAKTMALRITKAAELNAAGIKHGKVRTSKTEQLDILQETIEDVLKKSNIQESMKQALIGDTKQIAETILFNKEMKGQLIASHGVITFDADHIIGRAFKKVAVKNQSKMTLTPQMKLETFTGMNKIRAGSAEAMVSRMGGVRKVLGGIFGVDPGDVGNIDIVNEAFSKLSFENVQQLRNFTRSISDVMPGLEVGITTTVNDKHNVTRTVTGRVGDFKDANGATAMVATMSDGSKARLVDSDEQSVRFLGLGSYDAEDVSVSKTNSANKHWSVDGKETRLVAGLSGNYDMITRRQGYNTSGMDPISTFKLLNEAVADGRALMFDFETTGLPGKMPDEMAFSPIEFSYAEFDFKNKIRKKDVTSLYSKPNEAVQEMFADAMGMKDFDFVNDLPTEEFKKIGSKDANYSLLKNYSKYDRSRVKLGENTYVWGAVTNAPMKLGSTGTLIAELNGLEVDTKLTPDQMIEQTKKSADGVFKYLRDATPTTKKKYGIDPEMIFNEKDFVAEVGSVFDDHKYLIGHNISTADVPWYQQWAIRNDTNFNIGTKAYTSVLDKMIDTQDLLQASNSGRRFNNLEQFATNSTTSHLAYADVITNGNLVKKLLRESQVKTMQAEVERGLVVGDHLLKTRSSKIGMTEIPRGAYVFSGASGGSITLKPLLENGETGNAITFSADNPAVLKKEMADNWINMYDNKEKAIETITKGKSIDANRTLFNGMYNGSLDRYEYIGRYGNMDLQESLLMGYQEIYGKSVVTPEELAARESGTRFTSQSKAGPVDKDLMLFINSNANKLNNDKDGFTKELGRIRNINQDRIPEMQMVSDYLGTDEGKLMREFVDGLEYRQAGGVYSGLTREKLGRLAYETVADIKRGAVEEGLIDSSFMIDSPNRYNVGKVTFADLSDDMQKHLKAIEPYFGEINLSLSLGSAEQVKGDIFTMGDSIAEKIVGMEGVKDIHTAKQRVVNEVILPKLTKLSNDTALNEAINSRAITNTVTDEYKHAVYTMASEIVGNRAHLEKTLEPMKVLDMIRGIQETDENSKEVLRRIQEALKGIIAAEDFEVGSLPNPIPDAEQKRIAIPGAQESIDKIVEIQEATKKQYLKSIQESEPYQAYVKQYGIDPIADGVNPLSMWNMSLENSEGRKLSATMTPEYRFTSNPNKKWMQFKSASDLRNIMESMPSPNAVPSFESIYKAFANKGNLYEKAQNFHRERNADVIEFIEGKMGKDISHVRDFNAQIMNWEKEYRNERRLSTQSNTRHRGEIARELWKRSEMTDRSYRAPLSGNTITQEIMASHPTKYNAMKEIGMMQPLADGSGYYTGSIGIGGHIDGKTLDASKILIPGNAGSTQYGVGINELAGRPLASLSIGELGLVANNADAPYNTELFKTYYDGVKKLNVQQQETYEKLANDLRSAFEQGERAKPLKNIHNLVPEYTDALGNQDYIGAVNKQIKESANDKAVKEVRNQFAENLNQITKSFSDNPLYSTIKGNMQGVGDFLSQHKKGISIGAAVLGVAAALKLTSPKSSNGRSQDQSPQSNQAPTVDGNYNTGYNKHEGSRDYINPQSKTVRLEENGKGLAVRARGKNRSGIADGNIDKAVSDTMQSTMSANVRINHTDDRSNIDSNYVQGLVSNALFA